MKRFLSDDSNKYDLVVGGLALLCLLLGSKLAERFMPGSLVMLAIAIFTACFALFAMLIWRERPADEREAQIIMASDRWGFLAGGVALAIAILVQTWRHQQTSFLIAAIMVMILAKLLGKYLQK